MNQFKMGLKLAIAIAFFAALLGSSLTTEAYPPFLRQAAKFGAKNCLFCHKEASGGEGWNQRGEWLMAEKERRKADSIDVSWLEEYKEEGEGEKKPEPPPSY
jgi:hypothetical protein